MRERDKGICALCGIDCEKEFARLKEISREISKLWLWFCQAKMETERMECREAVRLGVPYERPIRDFHQERSEQKDFEARWMPPLNGWSLNKPSAWEADHILPVVEGGGECTLDNLRTLCHPCHKKETKALAERRAAARRAEQDKQSNQPNLL